MKLSPREKDKLLISLAAIVSNLVTQEIVDEVDSKLLDDFRPSRFF